MEMPTTGEELTIWRQKTGVSVEALADRINRLPVSVRNWEQDGKTKLPPSVLKRLQHCYNSDGTPKATNEPDGMLDDFNDYDGNELEFSVRLKEKFNDLVKDPSNSVDRLVLTDVDNAIANGLSTIWLASDEGNEGRQIGDRLVRRIVLDFHKRSSDPDANKKRRFLHGDLANNSDAERHVYVCEDGDKRYACSAKAVEFDDGTNSNNFVLAISSRGAPRAGFNTEAVPMKEAAKTFLRALGRLKKG